MKFRFALAAVVFPLAMLSLTACGSDSGDGHVEVVAGFYPLAYAAEQIGGEHVRVTDLTTPGAEPHDLELSPRQVAAVGRADLAVHLQGLQPAVDKAIEVDGPKRVVDALAEVPDLIHTDGHGEGVNPHVWLDPANMTRIATAIEKQLSKADSGHAEEYAANLAKFTQEMTTLSSAYEAGLATCRIDDVVVSHDAFAYLPTPFTFHGIAGLSPDAEPTAAHLAKLHTLVKKAGITTVFTETLASHQLADSLAKDLGLRTAVLDPIEGLTGPDAGEDYVSLMNANLAALEEANLCR